MTPHYSILSEYGKKQYPKDYEISHIPLSILRAEFLLTEIIKKDCPEKFVFNSGFLGVSQDPETLLVKPVIGWYIEPKSHYFAPLMVN